MSGNINAVTITDITDCEDKDIEIIQRDEIPNNEKKSELTLDPVIGNKIDPEEILFNKSDNIHNYLKQSHILKEIIKSCFDYNMKNSKFFECDKYDIRYRYSGIDSINNTIVKKFRIADIIYHKIDINVCFGVYKNGCNNNSICGCKIDHTLHSKNNCIHCIWKEDPHTISINRVLSIFYITFLTETQNEYIEKTIIKTMNILSLQYKDPKIFFVYKHDLSQRFIDAMCREYGVISVKLDNNFNYWLSEQKTKTNLIF